MWAGGGAVAWRKSRQEWCTCAACKHSLFCPGTSAPRRYSEQSRTKCIGMTIETRPDFCLTPHLSQMLSYGCTRLEIGLQVRGVGCCLGWGGVVRNTPGVWVMACCSSVLVQGNCPFSNPISLPFHLQSTYEDVARDTNRGHTVAAVGECFHLAKDAGFKVRRGQVACGMSLELGLPPPVVDDPQPLAKQGLHTRLGRGSPSCCAITCSSPFEHGGPPWLHVPCCPQVIAHMMPDLPNVGWERDIESFREFFENPAFRTGGRLGGWVGGCAGWEC